MLPTLEGITSFDPTAPRFRQEHLDILLVNNWRHSGNEFYSNLKKKYPNLAKYEDHQIKSIIIKFNGYLIEQIVEHRDGVQLPGKLGMMMICTFKRKSKSVDIYESRKAGKLVYYSNTHSGGYTACIHYSNRYKDPNTTKYRRNYVNAEMWGFISDLKFNRCVAKGMKEDWKKYRARPKFRKQEYFDQDTRDIARVNAVKRKVEKLKQNYNEFDI